MKMVCATDMTPRGDAAIERAGMLADQLGASLSLLHVVVPHESGEALEQALRTANARMQARVLPPLWRARSTPGWAVHAGSPLRVVPEAAARHGARLLVLGPHDKRPLRDALEGTVAEKALGIKEYPVLVVRSPVAGPYRRVLLALDLSDTSAGALRAAESLMLGPEAHASVVHAHEPPYHSMLAYAGVDSEAIRAHAGKWRREARRSVLDLLDCESRNPARYDVQVAQRPAAPAILRAVKQFSPDLLVMGTHGGGSLRRALVGSVASRVLNETQVDALIVPEGSFERDFIGTKRTAGRGARAARQYPSNPSIRAA